jgi:hypothetical protein
MAAATVAVAEDTEIAINPIYSFPNKFERLLWQPFFMAFSRRRKQEIGSKEKPFILNGFSLLM